MTLGSRDYEVKRLCGQGLWVQNTMRSRDYEVKRLWGQESMRSRVYEVKRLWGQGLWGQATMRSRVWGQELCGQETIRSRDYEVKKLWGQRDYEVKRLSYGDWETKRPSENVPWKVYRPLLLPPDLQEVVKEEGGGRGQQLELQLTQHYHLNIAKLLSIQIV